MSHRARLRGGLVIVSVLVAGALPHAAMAAGRRETPIAVRGPAVLVPLGRSTVHAGAPMRLPKSTETPAVPKASAAPLPDFANPLHRHRMAISVPLVPSAGDYEF